MIVSPALIGQMLLYVPEQSLVSLFFVVLRPDAVTPLTLLSVVTLVYVYCHSTIQYSGLICSKFIDELLEEVTNVPLASLYVLV